MKKDFFLVPKRRHTSFLGTLIFSLLLLNACNSNNTKEEGIDSDIFHVFKMNCTRLTKAQIQTWIDSGWTKSPTPITKILLQCYSEDIKKGNKNMQLITYPSVDYLHAKANGEQIAAIDNNCKELKLTSKVVFGNNYLDIASLDIFNTDGTLKDFDYIQITPTLNAKGLYLTFEAEVIPPKGAPKLPPKKVPSDPCPTFCQ